MMSEKANDQAGRVFSVDDQVALLGYLAMSNDPSRWAPESEANSILPLQLNGSDSGCVDQLSMRPRTASALHGLPVDRTLNATNSRLAENELDGLQHMLLLAGQERQQRSLLRERQLVEALVNEVHGRVVEHASPVLTLGAATISANQEMLRLSSFLRHLDLGYFPTNPRDVSTTAFRPEYALTVPDWNVGRHRPAAPPLQFARSASDQFIPGREVGVQQVKRCPPEGEAFPRERKWKRKRIRRVDMFPVILHRLLSDAESLGNEGIVSFTPSGRAFRVHQPNSFISEVAPKYFRQKLFSSFTRQLNLYGFDKLTIGPDEGAFAHVSFQRGNPDLCRCIIVRPPGDYRAAREPSYRDFDECKVL